MKQETRASEIFDRLVKSSTEYLTITAEKGWETNRVKFERVLMAKNKTADLLTDFDSIISCSVFEVFFQIDGDEPKTIHRRIISGLPKSYIAKTITLLILIKYGGTAKLSVGSLKIKRIT